MDSFWSKLLILGIVAAIGMFFISNVYNPQKAAQQAMAYSTQQSVNAVRAGVDGIVPLSYSNNEVISTVNSLCGPSNTTNVVIVKKLDGTQCIFTTSTTYGGQDISSIVASGSHYLKETNSNTITFTQQS
ncbi:MAG: hypothetical protein K0S75_182 [Clostridia bacterium]|jgi:hypothetical protein|nr:hypothetical protein [Clostridia bacterium]